MQADVEPASCFRNAQFVLLHGVSSLTYTNSNSYALIVKRDSYKTVTVEPGTALDILIKATTAEAEGEATWENELSGRPRPVRVFTTRDRKAASSQLKDGEAKLFDALLALRGALESRDPLQEEKAKNMLEEFYRIRESDSSSDESEDADLNKLLAKRSGLGPSLARKVFEGLRPGQRAICSRINGSLMRFHSVLNHFWDCRV